MLNWKAPIALRKNVGELTSQALRAALGPRGNTEEAIVSLSLETRLRIAICVAPHCGDDALVNELGRWLDDAAGEGNFTAISNPAAWTSHFPPEEIMLFEHSVSMAVRPTETGQESIEGLRRVGITESQIVAASQVTAFTAYFGRLRRATDLLDELSRKDYASILIPYSEIDEHPFGHPRQEYPLMDWRGFVIGVPMPDTKSSTDDAKGASDYYSVLRHEEGFLAVRTELYDMIMTGDGALERSDREFVALATSLETGCEFCASVHGRRHFFLSKDTVSTPRLKHLGIVGLSSPRERALAGFASAMAMTPSKVEAGHIEAMREQGLSDQQIMDAASVSSMFSWANRLMLTLGEGTTQK